ncbi:MAG: DUF5908 family protein [Cyanobacteria bacterium P01_D01_bin.44]
MPVEVRELIIRTTVVNPSGEDASESATSSGEDSIENSIVAACVAQVLKILERKRER